MYSICFRKQVLVIREKEKLTIRQAAKRFGISVRSVVNWLQRLAPKTKRNKPATKIDMEVLKEDVDKYPDAYLYERALRLKASISGIYGALKRLHITYKKNSQSPQSRSRKAFYVLPKIKSYAKNGNPLVYIDESGFEDDMPRTHGCSLKGKRCFGKSDWNTQKRTNVIGALLGKFLLTVSLFTATINTDVFLVWLEKDLMCKLPENSVVIMDNASFHKSSKIRKALESHGHILEYLPPYSPDLNPIEPKWAQSKKLRRKQQCSIDDLFNKNMATL